MKILSASRNRGLALASMFLPILLFGYELNLFGKEEPNLQEFQSAPNVSIPKPAGSAAPKSAVPGSGAAPSAAGPAGKGLGVKQVFVIPYGSIKVALPVSAYPAAGVLFKSVHGSYRVRFFK